MDEEIKCRFQYINDLDPFLQPSYSREPIKPLQYNVAINRPVGDLLPEVIRLLQAPHKAGDAALQIFTSSTSDLGSYLDLDLSLSEQPDELQTLQSDPLKSTLVVRQQPSFRVRTIIDKLKRTSGRDQRRVLFSLKSIFQDDKDLVHEFVQCDGLECLVKLGRQSDQNHQNHILRAIGQLMLYVDGMNGVIVHTDTIAWFYALLDSPYRLVVKTSLKLLLVFVEYTESNSLILLAVINKVERERSRPDWYSLMRILNERQASDEETLAYAVTVVNKTLSGIPDQDTFYDVVDMLESQGMEEALKEMMRMNNAQLTQQCHLYESELKREDAIMQGESMLDSQLVKMRINGTGLPYHSHDTAGNNNGSIDRRNVVRRRPNDTEEPGKQQRVQITGGVVDKLDQLEQQLRNGSTVIPPPPGIPPWLKSKTSAANGTNGNMNKESTATTITATALPTSDQDSAEGIPLQRDDEDVNLLEQHQMKAPPPSIPIFSPTEPKSMSFPAEPAEKEPEAPPPPQQNTTNTPKLQQRDSEEEVTEGGGFAALLQRKAKKMEGSAFRKGLLEPSKPLESETKWKEAGEKLKEKPVWIINDLDFSQFLEFEQDPLVLVKVAEVAQEKGLLPGGQRAATGTAGVLAPPVPPPLLAGGAPPPPPPTKVRGRDGSPGPNGSKGAAMRLLHWKAALAEAPPVPALRRKGTFWNRIDTPAIDTSKLAKLFEQKAKETATAKKLAAESKPQVLQVLSVKRSQAINIGLTKLPPISVIPTAIRKFDATVLNKESIEKILHTMLPSLEEIERIRESQAETPELTLGQAEQFLLNLSEIDSLLERLRLWLFMLDYHNMEKDVAESLMDLNNAMTEVEESKTFRVAMGMLLTMGNTLNQTDIKAFQLDYLSKASELKDPVHKYPLTHHLAEYMLDRYPDGSDLYSELGAVSRCSRIDFDAVQDNLKKMEVDCKSCFDYVARISQKDNNSSMRAKVNQFLVEVAERIHRIKHVHRTAANRWSAFLIYFGYAANEVREQKPTAIFKMVIEFALEYRTNRDKILQMRKRMAEKRERNKTRGLMIGAAQSAAVSAQHRRQRGAIITTDRERHQEMSRLLTANGDDGVMLARRRGQPTPERSLIAAQTEALRRSPGTESPDDELLDGVVRTLTHVTAHGSDPKDPNRRRARLFNRKSLRRTRTIRQDQVQLAELNNLNNY